MKVAPDLTPCQVVADERTNMFAVFGKQYVVRTVFLLVVFVLLHGGIIYGFGVPDELTGATTSRRR